MVMQFKDGTPVYTAGGDEAGRISRVVFDPVTKEVTHIVVRQGLLFTEDKVIPVDMLESADSESAVMRSYTGDPDDLPNFEETYYVPAERVYEGTIADPVDTAGTLYMYPPVGMFSYSAGLARGVYPTERRYMESTRQNIPENTLALKEGAQVLNLDDEVVGHIESIIIDEETGFVTHVVISQGFLFTRSKLIPASWLQSLDEDSMLLVVDTDLVNGLPDY
jgi:uncharacterized protein YrrD